MPDKRALASLALGGLLALLVPPAPAVALGAGAAALDSAYSGAAGAADADGAGQAAATGPWFPGGSSFAPLLATPREVSLRGSLVLADRDAAPGADFEGRNVEAEVGMGHRIPVVRLQEEGDGRPEITLGFEVGVFTRFHMETAEKDLVNADFRVALPLSGRLGAWEARLAVLHVSSHVGDDFDARFDLPFRQVTRDGVEATLARRLGDDLRLYGGADVNFHANPGVERTAARWGVEWDPAPPSVGFGAGGASRREAGDGPVASAGSDPSGVEAWPFAAADFQVTSQVGRVAATAVAGLGLRVSDVVLRLEARGHLGPSPMGQFRTVDESFAGLGLRVIP